MTARRGRSPPVRNATSVASSPPRGCAWRSSWSTDHRRPPLALAGEGLRDGRRCAAHWALDAEIPMTPRRDARGDRRGGRFHDQRELPWVRRLAGTRSQVYWRSCGQARPRHHARCGQCHRGGVVGNDLDGTMAGSLYRSATEPLRVGDRIASMAESGGPGHRWQQPWRTRFTFDGPLDDLSYLSCTRRARATSNRAPRVANDSARRALAPAP